MVRFALVHGTTQSPAGWNLLVDALGADGHEAAVVDVGHGVVDRSPEQLAGGVAQQLVDSPVDVVVAHSGSGLLLPAIAVAVRSRLHVYLAAAIPSGDRSFLDELDAAPTDVAYPDWIGVDPTDDHDAARHFLFHDCGPQRTTWALSTLRSFIPTMAYRTVIRPAVGDTAVIVPAADRTLRPDWMMDAARERLGVDAHVLDGAGHCPQVSKPDQLAELLVQLAN